MISAWRKDEMRTQLKMIKKRVDDADKTRKSAMMQQVSGADRDLTSHNCVMVH